MPNIKIDDKEYDFDTLSDEAKKQLRMLQYIDGELARLQAQGAVLQTARGAYVNALKAALPSPLLGIRSSWRGERLIGGVLEQRDDMTSAGLDNQVS